VHELGVIITVVETIEKIAREQHLTKIESLVLQIGELSSIVPQYLESCYPAAVDGTMLQNTKLRIEVIPGNAMCKNCHKVYHLSESSAQCPHCGSDSWELISGKEFSIKEITAC
jgi:hydrogenase nickel incorporation protein HypA/HybF